MTVWFTLGGLGVWSPRDDVDVCIERGGFVCRDTHGVSSWDLSSEVSSASGGYLPGTLGDKASNVLARGWMITASSTQICCVYELNLGTR